MRPDVSLFLTLFRTACGARPWLQFGAASENDGFHDYGLSTHPKRERYGVTMCARGDEAPIKRKPSLSIVHPKAPATV